MIRCPRFRQAHNRSIKKEAASGSGAAIKKTIAAERKIMIVNGSFKAAYAEDILSARRKYAAGKKENFDFALKAGETAAENTADKEEAADYLSQILREMEQRYTPEQVKRQDDWREMNDEQWDKLMEYIDLYIDEFKEELERKKEEQEEAAKKAMAYAPADRRALAVAKAMLRARTNGLTEGGADSEASHLEKISWTYDIKTEDQVVLATAKLANEFAPDMISRAQEIALTGDTSEGIRRIKGGMESASLEEDEKNGKTWIIIEYTAEGMICKQYKDGKIKELWRLEYRDPGEAEMVWDFLAGLDQDADLKFANSQKFWEDFLTEKRLRS